MCQWIFQFKSSVGYFGVLLDKGIERIAGRRMDFEGIAKVLLHWTKGRGQSDGLYGDEHLLNICCMGTIGTDTINTCKLSVFRFVSQSLDKGTHQKCATALRFGVSYCL